MEYVPWHTARGSHRPGVTQTGSHPFSTWEWTGPSVSSRLSVLWSLEAKKWGKQAVTSWEKPSWERPKGRPSTYYLHFFQNNSIWNKFDAKTHTGSILCPYYTPPYVVRAAWDKMFSLLNVFTWFTTLEHTLVTHSHGHLEGACKNIQDAEGKVVGVHRAHGGGGGGEHRLRPCFYHAFSKTLVSNTAYSRIVRKVAAPAPKQRPTFMPQPSQLPAPQLRQLQSSRSGFGEETARAI